MPRSYRLTTHPRQATIRLVSYEPPAPEMTCCCGPGNYCPVHGTFEPAADLETQDLVHDLNHAQHLMVRSASHRVVRKTLEKEV